jgi:hypothetical protein
MITKKTCFDIWNCYEAIDRCKKLITDMKEQLDKTGDERLIDAFGRKKGLELGIPCGDSGHRIFNVRIDLAVKIIEANIKDNEDELKKLMAVATIELKG